MAMANIDFTNLPRRMALTATVAGLIAAGLVCAVAWAMASVPSWWVSAPLAVLVGMAGVGIALAISLFWHQRIGIADAYLRRLAQLDPRDMTEETVSANLPQLPTEFPLGPALERIQAAFTRFCTQIQDAEQGRALLDIRCRRASQQSEQMSQILAGLAEPVLVVDQYNDLVLANRSAEKLFGFQVEGVEHRALAKLVKNQRLIDLLKETHSRSTGTARTDEIEIVDDVGRPCWYSVTATMLMAGATSTDTAPHLAVVVLRDISSQKAAQRRNAEFVSSVTHEMKTPLAGIKAYVELLADGDAEDEATRDEFLDVINTQADRLQRLIENMLNLARIEAGAVRVNKAHCSLNELLEEALDIVQPAAQRKSIELVAELSPMHIRVFVDRDLMLQTAINLLSNAVKYTPDGGRVTMRSRLVDDQVEFEVQDTGVGLSEDDCERIFDKFYRVEKDSQMASGTGLGLPLAKHIVSDVHQGNLSVTSRPGEGSTFVVTLPGTKQMTKVFERSTV